MSISSEISRISGNISDSLDAVAAKGVTVPSGSTSDNLADLIEQIGGGAVSVVDSLDSKGGTIRSITGVDISSDTVTAGSLLYGITAHSASGMVVTGTIASKSGTDLTANTLTVTVPAGYYASSASKTLSDVSLVSGNIRSGCSIFGVSGSTTVVNTSDANATAGDIASGKTAYVNGVKIIGTGSGGTPAISIVDTADPAGGDVRTITALDISDTTAIASDVLNSKYFYTAQGQKVQGTATGGVQIETGTFTGNGTGTQAISCSFAPDLIYIFGDLSGTADLRGIISITILKDTQLVVFADSSTSTYSEYLLYGVLNGLVGYNESDTENPHASYFNNTVTLDMVYNSGTARFASEITYNYKLIKWS